MGSKAKELYVLKEHKSCQSYFIDDVKPNSRGSGGLYIRPDTALLFKPIDKGLSKTIYNAMMNFIEEIHAKNKHRKTSADGQELSLGDIFAIDKHLQEQMATLKDDDRDIAMRRMVYLRSVFKRNDDIVFAIRYAFDIEFVEEFELSEMLLTSNFEERDIFDAVADLSEIGKMASKYSFEELFNCDTCTAVLSNDNLIEKVHTFANMYGVLGILPRMFNVKPGMSPNSDFGSVETVIKEVLHYIEPVTTLADRRQTNDPSRAAYYRQRFGTMQVPEYIKLFFPDTSLIQYYDDCIQLDSMFWATYSEPLSWFLVTARSFYEEFKAIKIEGNKHSMSLGNPNLRYEYDDNSEINVFRMEFSSLYDAIRYCTVQNALRMSQKLLICEYCFQIFVKGDRRKTRFCPDTTCGGNSRKVTHATRHNKGKKQVQKKDQDMAIEVDQ